MTLPTVAKGRAKSDFKSIRPASRSRAEARRQLKPGLSTSHPLPPSAPPLTSTHKGLKCSLFSPEMALPSKAVTPTMGY